MILDISREELDNLIFCMKSTDLEFGGIDRALLEKLEQAHLSIVDQMHEAAANIMKNRRKIVDDFCKAFLACHEAPNLDAMKEWFSLIELECTLDGLNETYRIKMRSHNV